MYLLLSLGRIYVLLSLTPGCLGTATLSSQESSQSCSSFPRRQFSAPLDAGVTSSPFARSASFNSEGNFESWKSWKVHHRLLKLRPLKAKNLEKSIKGCWNASEDIPSHPREDNGHPCCCSNDCNYALWQEVAKDLSLQEKPWVNSIPTVPNWVPFRGPGSPRGPFCGFGSPLGLLFRPKVPFFSIIG